MKKVLFVSSCGGHLTELLKLSPMFDDYNFKIITEKTSSTLWLKDKYKDKVNFLVYGTKDHILTYPFKLLYNVIKGLILIIKFRPSYIVTTGAHTGGIITIIGKLFKSKIIYIETFANRNSKTITGKLVYKYADLFIVQHKECLKLYPKATYGGWIF